MPYKIPALFHVWFRFYLSEQLDRSDVIALLDYAEKLAREVSDKPFKKFARCFTKRPYKPTGYVSSSDKYRLFGYTTYNPDNRAMWENFLTHYPKGYMSFRVYNLFFEGIESNSTEHYDVYVDYDTSLANYLPNVLSVAINGDLLREEFGLATVDRIAQTLIKFLRDRNISIDYGLIAPIETFKGRAFFDPDMKKRFPYTYPATVSNHTEEIPLGYKTLAEEKRLHRLKQNNYANEFYNEKISIKNKVWSAFWGNIITYHQLEALTREAGATAALGTPMPKRKQTIYERLKGFFWPSAHRKNKVTKADIPTIISALAAAIAPNKITHIDEQTLFFTLPLDVTQFFRERSRYSSACKKVDQVLKKYGVRMEAHTPFSFKKAKFPTGYIPLYPGLNLFENSDGMLQDADDGLLYFPYKYALCLEKRGYSLSEIAKRLYLSKANAEGILYLAKKKRDKNFIPS